MPTSKDNNLNSFQRTFCSNKKNSLSKIEIITFHSFLYPPFESISTSTSNLDEQQGRQRTGKQHTRPRKKTLNCISGNQRMTIMTRISMCSHPERSSRALALNHLTCQSIQNKSEREQGCRRLHEILF